MSSREPIGHRLATINSRAASHEKLPLMHVIGQGTGPIQNQVSLEAPNPGLLS